MAKPGRDLQNAIRDYLRLKGWLVWSNSAGCFKAGDRFIRSGTVGLPDLMALKRGFLLAVEVKAGKDTLKEKQQAWIDALNAQGADAIVAHSVEDVIKYLDGTAL